MIHFDLLSALITRWIAWLRIEKQQPKKEYYIGFVYIKLGLAGAWESDCITRDQTLRLDYREAPHDLCLRGKWDEVREIYKAFRKDIGAATSDSKQIRLFYESDETVLWITFFGDRMYWCFSKPEITLLEDKSKIRPVIGHWRSTDIKNNPLQKNQLSGRLLSTEGFRGTICSVKEFDYLVQRINGKPLKQIGEAKEALLTLEQKIETLIRALHWKDFEILIDLIFSPSGLAEGQRLGRDPEDHRPRPTLANHVRAVCGAD